MVSIRKRYGPAPVIAGFPYLPCWCCVHGWRGVFNNKPSKFCGTPETTSCPIAIRFLKRLRNENNMPKL